ncbi:N-methyl-L-tryptophan oxidase [Fictibacillus sp. Mic-4]|uniref:N-methyl-L-tryptophan oxidase n=1 Tax=Fictibacillus sp. Mic-4 TaxID=3132826 RepID=UPI003CEB21D0
MNRQYETVIVGAGSMGMAAGYFLAKSGKKTLVIDAYDPPHHFGSHHGDTRIIRHAYGEGRKYVPFALRAQELWSELEKESGRKLFSQTGVLCAGAPGSPFTEEVIESARQFNLSLEVLTSDEINERWPGLKLPEGFVGCLETDSGVLFSEECIRSYRQLGLDYGMNLLTNTPVQKIDMHSDGVTIHTSNESYQADSVIVSAGAWTGDLFKRTGIELPLQPIRKTVAWFECDEKLYDFNCFPAFTFHLGDEHYYGFPSFNGCGVKVGRHDGGQKVDPDHANREFGIYPEDEGDVRSFLERFLPNASGRLKQGKVCLYTLTPDEHFIIDRHPQYSHVIVASGFSGHGFKFSSAVGEALSEMITKGKAKHDLSMFSLTRSGHMQGGLSQYHL